MYDKMLIRVSDEKKGREDYEWSNFWYDQSNVDVKHRILLIGDSSMRFIRSTMAKLLGNEYAVDYLGTSSGLHDILFVSQIEAFFSSSNYIYETIIVQLGHHSRINEEGMPYTTADYEIFRQDYKTLIQYLQNYSSNIIAESIFFSVIPWKGFWGKVKRFFRMKEKYDDVVNEIKTKKNKEIQSVVDELGIHYHDINAYMLNQKRYVHSDHIHFVGSAKKFLSNEIIREIKKTYHVNSDSNS